MANEKKYQIRTAILRANSILDDSEIVLDITPNRANRLYVGRDRVKVKDLRYFVISNSPLLGGELGEINIGDVQGLQEALDAKANTPVELTALDIPVTPFYRMTAGMGTGTYRDSGTESNGRPVFLLLGGDPSIDQAVWTGYAWRTRNTASNRPDKIVYESTDDVADPTLATTWLDQTFGEVGGVLPVFSELNTGTVQEVLEQLATQLFIVANP